MSNWKELVYQAVREIIQESNPHLYIQERQRDKRWQTIFDRMDVLEHRIYSMEVTFARFLHENKHE